jgi:hypothetical protein
VIRIKPWASVASLAAAVLAFAGTVPPAAAATPFRGYFDLPETGTDPAGTTCAFPVDYSQDEYGFFEAYVDQAGNVVKVMLHSNYDATISANGHTLVERDTWTRTIYPDGTMSDVGSTVHIQGLGDPALVLRDAGRIVYSDTSETVQYVAGPHPQLFGASFCSALEG